MPADVLVDFSLWCGDGGACPSGKALQLTLYGNGLLLRVKQGGFGQFTKLDRHEICKVLNTIDQTGFAQYDRSTYFSTIMGGGSVEIEIETWFEKRVDIPNLGSHLNPWENPHEHLIPKPTILSSLKDTYYFLRYHDFGNWKPYIPERIAIDLLEDTRDVPAVDWNFDSIGLAEMLNYDSQSWRAIILQGDLALEWFETMTEGYYIQEGLVVDVTYTVVPPHEDVSDYVVLGVLEKPINISANEPLSCKVTDGVYPIPTPPSP